jgi:hypothetical protein
VISLWNRAPVRQSAVQYEEGLLAGHVELLHVSDCATHVIASVVEVGERERWGSQWPSRPPERCIDGRAHLFTEPQHLQLRCRRHRCAFVTGDVEGRPSLGSFSSCRNALLVTSRYPGRMTSRTPTLILEEYATQRNACYSSSAQVPRVDRCKLKSALQWDATIQAEKIRPFHHAKLDAMPQCSCMHRQACKLDWYWQVFHGKPVRTWPKPCSADDAKCSCHACD